MSPTSPRRPSPASALRTAYNFASNHTRKQLYLILKDDRDECVCLHSAQDTWMAKNRVKTMIAVALASIDE
jgi:hypothetical protein